MSLPGQHPKKYPPLKSPLFGNEAQFVEMSNNPVMVLKQMVPNRS